jgi:hypothetical protein
MHRLAILFIFITSMTLVPDVASAQPSPQCTGTEVNDSDADRLCTWQTMESSDGSQHTSLTGRPPSGGSSPQKRYLPYDKLTTAPDGQPCMTTGYHEEGTVPTDGVPANPAYPQPYIYANLAESYAPCPEQPRQPGQPAILETPSMVAARYWERIPLPKPRPTIAPGRAITGKLAYLETRGQTTDVYTSNTVLGALSIVATGYYTVDWGDGTTSGPHRYEGKPWPDGQITHEYQDVGTYDIVVTERWTSSWQLGGQSGVLRELRTTGRIDNFPVEQIQAVIGR